MAKLKTFKAEAGISLELQGTWYKFHCGVEIEIEPNDDPNKVKEMAWNTVSRELEKQVEEVTK